MLTDIALKFGSMKRLLLLLPILFMFLNARAQDSTAVKPIEKGTISGHTLGSDGYTLAATIIYIYNGTEIVGSATSDSVGNYLSNRIVPGTYKVVVVAPGYIKREVESVPILGWKDTPLDIVLEPTRPGAQQPQRSVYEPPPPAEKK